MVCFSDTRVRELEGDVLEICLSSDTTGTCAALSLPHCYISPVICNLCWRTGSPEMIVWITLMMMILALTSDISAPSTFPGPEIKNIINSAGWATP